MKLILCRSKTVGSWFLRLVMWSRWSHSAVFDEEVGIVYDTTMLQGGVAWHDSEKFFSRYPDHEVRVLTPTETDDKARIWLVSQLHKGYDWTALLSFVVRRNWQAPDSWFCSEFSETVRSLFGTPVFRENMARVTPYHQDIVV